MDFHIVNFLAIILYWKKLNIKLYFFYLKLISLVPQVSPTPFVDKNHAYFPSPLHIHYYISTNI